MNQPWYDRGWKIIICLCRLALLLFLGIVTIQALTAYPDAEFLQATQPKWVLAALVCVMAYGLFEGFRGIRRLLQKAGEGVLQIICIVAPCFLLIGQLCFLLYYRSLYMWDTAYVVGGASGLVKNGQVAKEAWYYFSIYPNQNAFAVLTQGLLKIAAHFRLDGGQTQLLLNAVNMAALDLAILSGILVWKKLRAGYTKADLAFLWIVILTQPFFYMGVSYYYTITLSLPWLMGAVYLIISMYQSRNKALPVVAGLVLAIGFLLRATTGIVLIAAVFCALFPVRAKENETTQAQSRGCMWAESLVILAVMIFTVFITKPFLAQRIGIDTTDTAFPATHWVMMSLTSPGCHNAEDEAYTASFATAEEKKEAVRERIQEKLSGLGVKGYGRLVLDKIRNTWASGANSYVLFMENCLRMDGIYPYLFGNHKDFAILYHQGIHLLILIGMLLSVFLRIRGGQEKDRSLFFMQLTVLGGFLFYVLWETSGQYSLPFFMLMLLLALDGYRLAVQGDNTLNGLFLSEDLKKKRKEAEGKNLSRWMRAGFGILSLLFVLAFFVKNISPFTVQTDTYKAPVVNQLIADKELEYRGTEPICQTFRTGDSFNELIFQWRNPVGEHNHAVYLVTLTDERGQEIWQQKIEAEGQGYAGAFQYDFDQVTPGGEEEYALTIQKTEGEEGEYLQFVGYECGDFDAYPFGKYTIAGETGSADLMFQVARIEQKSYTSRKRYLLTGIGILTMLLAAILMNQKKKEQKS